MVYYDYVNDWRLRHPSGPEVSDTYLAEILYGTHVPNWVLTTDSDVLTPEGANNPYLRAPAAPWMLIRYALFRLQMSQSELAKKIGVSRAFMTLMLRGERPISMEHALAIQEAICIPAHVLLRLQTDYELYRHLKNQEPDGKD